MKLMEQLKKPEPYIGAAALALCAGLANCPDRIESPASAVDSEQSDFGDKIRRKITTITNSEDSGSDDGISVDVEKYLDEEGKFPFGFSPGTLVRDCIEDHGDICSGGRDLVDKVICYPQSVEKNSEGVYPLIISRERSRRSTYAELKYENNFYLELNVGSNSHSYDFDLDNIEEVKNIAELACSDGLDLLKEKRDLKDLCEGMNYSNPLVNELMCEASAEKWDAYNLLGSVMRDENETLMDLANDMGFEASLGDGNIIELKNGDQTFYVSREVGIPGNEISPDSTFEPIFIVRSNYIMHDFATEDEVLDFVANADEVERKFMLELRLGQEYGNF